MGIQDAYGYPASLATPLAGHERGMLHVERKLNTIVWNINHIPMMVNVKYVVEFDNKHLDFCNLIVCFTAKPRIGNFVHAIMIAHASK